MGLLDWLFNPRQTYRGSGTSKDYYKNLIGGSPGQISAWNDIKPNEWFDIAGQKLQGEPGGLSALAKNYMSGVLKGEGMDPYQQGSPFQSYQQGAMRNFEQNVTPQLASMAGAKGLLRGTQTGLSGAQKTLGEQLNQMAFADYGRGREMQYGLSQFAPQLAIAESQAASGLGSMLTDIDFQNAMQSRGVEGQNILNALQAAGQYNQSFDPRKSRFFEGQDFWSQSVNNFNNFMSGMSKMYGGGIGGISTPGSYM